MKSEVRAMLPSLILKLFIFSGFFPIKICSVNSLHGFSPQRGGSPPAREDLAEQMDSFRYRGDGKLFDFPRRGENLGLYNPRTDHASMDYSSSILTREIKIKQGRLKGTVRELKNKNLRNVEVYLGIPYAAPPVGNLRFMPPGSPPTWRNLRTFDAFGPVCPQSPPDLSHEPHKTMNAGRFNHLKGLLPFLGNQSEDCLYLNIYAPLQEGRVLHKYPVIVYIHGESFEWNSGNPYDGSVLASYGKVIVVTINFRLGILGFLKPGISGPTVSNFGLLDQIAALQWVKENIGEFGGDPSSVTLMGHGTGAACINFLMVSPVSMASDGLFHKAILMSGTALSDWALTVNPLQFTIQVAEALNCPLIEENDELSNCLRKKRLSEIMSVRISVPEFQTPFGPVIDGSVVPNTPSHVMGIYQDLFTRYDLLYGMTEWESYHLLNAISLTFGMLERERDQLLRQYMHSKYEVLPDFALATTLNEYLYWRKPLQGNQPAAMEHLNLVLDLLSDARVIAPMVQMGLYHAKINPKSYMYIFQHKSKFGEFAGSEHSISGEEIPYVFGAPLLNGVGSLSHYRFSLSEQLLSEFILTYFTNFAKTGNPNAPRRSAYLTQGPREWQQFDVDWPEFDVKNQSFLSLGIPPHVDHQYRSPMTQFWNEELPNLLKNPTSIANKIKYPKPSVKHAYQPEGKVFDPWDVPQEKFSTDSSVHQEKQPRTNPTSYVYGTIRTSPVERHQHSNNQFQTDEKEKITSGQSDHPSETSTESGTVMTGSGNSMALTFFLIIGAAFLIINVFIFTLLYYKKKRLSLEEQRLNSASGTLDERTCDGSQTENRGCNMRIYDIVSKRREEDYEAIKVQRKEEARKCSTSTMDPQTRVREWIQQEILQKYTPNFYKGGRQYRGESSETEEPRLPVKPILKHTGDGDTLRKKGPERSVQKVSVAIDATPSTRGSSVLKQTPIEITKSLDRGLISVGADCDVHWQDEERSLRKSRTSVSLQMLPMESEADNPVIPVEPTLIKIQHFHSKSDPNENCLQTFVNKNAGDINVTSREPEDLTQKPVIMQEDMLKNIQKRNFPKVLPDLPIDLKRLSLPSSSHLQSFYSQKNKVPPPPPPRVSTLDRKHKDWTEEPKTMTSSATINFKLPENKKGEADEASEEHPSKRNPPQKAVPKTIIVASNSAPHKLKHPEPSIIIQPVIGPKSTKTKATPHVNLCNEDSLTKKDSSGSGVGVREPVSSEVKSSATESPDTEESSSSSAATKNSSTGTIRRTSKKTQM